MKTKQLYKNLPAQDKSKNLLQNSSKLEDNTRVTPKLFKNFEHVSVIQQAMDSVNSGQDIYQQLKNFGLETVVLNDDSYDMKHKSASKNIFNDATSRISRKSQPDNILDFSNMVKIKHVDSIKKGQGYKLGQILKRLIEINAIIKVYKQNFLQLKGQIQKQLSKSRQQSKKIIKQCQKTIKQKVDELKGFQQKQKQKIRKQIKILKQIIETKQKQITQLKNKNKKLQEQVQKQINFSNVNSTTVHGTSPTKSREIHNIKTRRFNTEAQDQNKKQSQVLGLLNKQIKQVQIDLQLYKQQNKTLRNTIKDLQQKIKLNEHNQLMKYKMNNKNQQNIETYNKFLQKIQALQLEINQLKIRQKDQKNLQISQWKQQIKVQLQEIDQFLFICQQRQKRVMARQKTLQIWQKRLQIKQTQLQKKEQQIKEAQVYLGQFQEQADLQQQKRQRSPKRLKITNLKTVPSPQTNKIAHSSILNEKMFRLSTPRQRNLQSYSSRPGVISKPDLFQRQNNQRVNSKYSDMINTRLNKIQSSIANQLYSLTHHN